MGLPHGVPRIPGGRQAPPCSTCSTCSTASGHRSTPAKSFPPISFPLQQLQLENESFGYRACFFSPLSATFIWRLSSLYSVHPPLIALVSLFQVIAPRVPQHRPPPLATKRLFRPAIPPINSATTLYLGTSLFVHLFLHAESLSPCFGSQSTPRRMPDDHPRRTHDDRPHPVEPTPTCTLLAVVI